MENINLLKNNAYFKVSVSDLCQFLDNFWDDLLFWCDLSKKYGALKKKLNSKKNGKNEIIWTFFIAIQNDKTIEISEIGQLCHINSNFLHQTQKTHSHWKWLDNIVWVYCRCDINEKEWLEYFSSSTHLCQNCYFCMNFIVTMYFMLENIGADSRNLNKAPCSIWSAKIEVYIK